MHSLRWKLVGTLILIVLVSVASMAFITDRNITREFEQYVCQCDDTYCDSIATQLSPFYTQGQSWDGVQGIITGPLLDESYRLIVADSSGVIVGDTSGDWLGRDIFEIGLGEGTPIVVSGKAVGQLYLLSGTGDTSDSLAGSCGMPVLGSAEQQLLNRTHQNLLITGVIAAGVALLLGLMLTRQTVRPIRALITGVRRISQGDLGYKVKVESKDELGELAQSFNSMTSRLHGSEQARRRLTADVAHELRTPLTIVEGTIDGILDGVFPADAEHLKSIKEQTALLTRLINDLRDLSLAESGQLKLELVPTNLTSLLARKLSEAEVAAREKGIDFKMDVRGEIPEIRVDPGRLEQVISNLLTNAIRHTPAGGSITVSLETVLSDREHGITSPSVILSVADNGEGIAPEHLPHIFERFYRVGDSRARSEGGTGLGLAIVSHMIQAHGGKVWVKSEVGKGSTFYISLPLTKD